MKYIATLFDDAGTEINNQIPVPVYSLISETLETSGRQSTLNPLKKYDTMSFSIFFASCVHNLLSELSHQTTRSLSPDLFNVFTQHILTIGISSDVEKSSPTSAVEKFFRMIKNHASTYKGDNFSDIASELESLIRTQAGYLDKEPLLSQCLRLISQFNISGISRFNISQEAKSRSSDLGPKSRSMSPKRFPISHTLKSLYQKYPVSNGNPTKLLRAIAHQANVIDLEHFSTILEIEGIINTQSPSGKTALHWLVKGAQLATTEEARRTYQMAYQWLIEHGVDITLTDEEGKTALEYDNLFILHDQLAQEPREQVLTFNGL